MRTRSAVQLNQNGEVRMTAKKFHQHALLVKIGRAEAGAYGLPAVTFLAVILIMALLWIAFR
jgi:hypothetical protein